MTTFDERERAYEAKFAQDAEMRFKREALRDKMVAAWAAALLGRDVEDYTREVIRADLEEAGPEDVISKLVADLGDKSSEDEIRARIAEYDIAARDQIMGA